MNLHDALTAIAAQIGANADELIAYATEDTVGGYHPDTNLRKWHTGSIFEEEGQILYAITRALKPTIVVNLGTFMGCSVSHIAEALKANGKGKVITVDSDRNAGEMIQGHLAPYIEFVTADAAVYMQNDMPSNRVKLVFEDLLHTVPNTRDTWEAAFKKMLRGGVVISHDALHYIVGKDVRDGIAQSGHEFETYLVEPSDCGLAVGVKR